MAGTTPASRTVQPWKVPSFCGQIRLEVLRWLRDFDAMTDQTEAQRREAFKNARCWAVAQWYGRTDRSKTPWEDIRRQCISRFVGDDPAWVINAVRLKPLDHGTDGKPRGQSTPLQWHEIPMEPYYTGDRFTADGTVICNWCNFPGHPMEECRRRITGALPRRDPPPPTWRPPVRFRSARRRV